MDAQGLTTVLNRSDAASINDLTARSDCFTCGAAVTVLVVMSTPRQVVVPRPRLAAAMALTNS